MLGTICFSKNYEKDLNERYEIAVNKSLINIFNNASASIIVDKLLDFTLAERKFN